MEQKKSISGIALISVAVIVLVVCTKVAEGNANKQDKFCKNGAVASEARVCSDIGVKAMKENGTAVDAAIATMFCLGLVRPHSSGIGGGGFMLIYQRSKKKATFLDFREMAPGASTQDMFVKRKTKSRKGELAVAVPGEVLAMYTAWKTYGRLPWKRLVQPTIDLATKGYKIDKILSIVLRVSKNDLKDEGFRKLYYRQDLSPRKKNEIITDPIFAKTLTEISENPMSMYNGSLAREIVKDIQARGGIITADDLKNFVLKIRNVLESSMTNDDILYTTSAPSSGSTIIMMLNILKGFNFSSNSLSNVNIVKTWHRILEAFKFGYAHRPYLGDPDFDSSVEKSMELQMNSTYAGQLRRMISDNVTHDSIYYGGFYKNPSDPGTTHLSVLDPFGDAISVTTTLGYYFGAKIRSNETGIVYNNHMSSFSIPKSSKSYQTKSSKFNYVAPGKRSLSTACPTIVVDKAGSVRMVVGGSGALRITSGVPTVLMNKLWFGLSLKDSINSPRLHHQLHPNQFTFETRTRYRMDKFVIDGLKALGHKEKGKINYCAIQGVYLENTGRIYAMSDLRKYGVASGF